MSFYRNRQARRLTIGFFFGVVLAVTCARAFGAYEVIDTQALGRREVYWIDNQRVLFPGYDLTRSITDGAKSSPQSVLYIWDRHTRQATVYADIPEARYVCYSDGFLSYVILKDGKRYLREGKIGAEIERAWNPPAPGSKIDRNELTCRDFDISIMDKVIPDFFFIPLRDGDGYYGWQKRESHIEAINSPIFYLPGGKGKKPIALPIAGGERDRISYSDYLGAYVIEYTPSQRKEDTVGKVRILYTNGKVVESIIPAGPWMRGSMGYVPAKPGIVMSSSATGRQSNFDPGYAGVYLVHGNKAQRLVSGFPSRPAVSPDGCKIAVVVNPLTGPGLKATLRVIDLCKKGD